VEHGLDVDVGGGADHRSGPDIPVTQVKSVRSAREKLFIACKARGEITEEEYGKALGLVR
jgi:hypothetical protein